jgi:putative transposase
MPWKQMLAWVTGQIDDSLREKLDFVLEENRVYRALLQRHAPGWRLQDAERKALAEKGRPPGNLLAQVITIVRPETLLRWPRRLVASKWDFSARRTQGVGRPPVDAAVEQRVVHMAQEESRLGL